MILSKSQAIKMIGGKPLAGILTPFIDGVNAYGNRIGLERPHILAMFISQIAHESGGFRRYTENLNYSADGLRVTFGKYFKTIQAANEYHRKPERIANRVYANRMENGNEASGDGWKFRGRTPMQCTGKYNYRKFSAWCRTFAQGAPDFRKEPDKINDAPWPGLFAIWYWQSNNLNKYADNGDIEMVTRGINGGLNGYADRLKRYDRAALVLLNFEPSGLKMFQKAEGLAVDGISGPATRGRLHQALKALSGRPVAPPVIDDVFIEDPIDKPAFTKPARRGTYGAIAALFAALFGRKRT